jgi:hypothetical protein
MDYYTYCEAGASPDAKTEAAVSAAAPETRWNAWFRNGIIAERTMLVAYHSGRNVQK